MKSITKTVYLTAQPASYENNGYVYRMTTFEHDDEITINSMEVTMDIPEDFDINTAHIDILKAEKSKIQAEAHLKAENLDEQIQRLLAIEYKPDPCEEKYSNCCGASLGDFEGIGICPKCREHCDFERQPED
jgi:hypothetical protein